jgi:hypothetical protein
MRIPYVETGCTIVHNGKAYTAGGAVVSRQSVVAYLANNGVLTDWQGKALGTYRVTGKWKTPRSYVSSDMWQVEATVAGIVYTGRSAGIGMVYSGKAKSKQPAPAKAAA